MSPSLPATEAAARLREEVLDWALRRQRPGWSAHDERAFRDWLAAGPARAQAWDRWSAHWQALDAIPSGTVDAWRAQATGAAAAPRRRDLLRPALALGVAGAVAGAGYLGWAHVQAQPLFVQHLATARGQQTEVQLPDGSRLSLDTATQLEVRLFRARREVRLLDGQAVFAVQADAGRPFDVLAGPLQVRVVGTRFAVRHTPGIAGADGVRVAVEEGRVRVAPRPRDADGDARWTESSAEPLQARFLSAGQQIASDRSGALSPVTALPREGMAPWRNQRLSFVDVPLARALAELERYGNTGLFVRDPAVAALRLSGTFDPRDPATLRRVLPAALPVRLSEAGGATEILPLR